MLAYILKRNYLHFYLYRQAAATYAVKLVL